MGRASLNVASAELESPCWLHHLLHWAEKISWLYSSLLLFFTTEVDVLRLHLNSIPLLRNTPSGTLMILHWLSSSIWHEFKKFRPFKLIESMYIYVYSFVCSAILLPSYYFKSCVPRLQVTNLILSLVLLCLQFSHVFC